jgi:hypothetical protein
MARGWESKSVEEQMAEAQAKAPEGGKRISPEELQQQQKKRGLQLALAKINNDLTLCSNDRHRAMLEAARKELETQLSALSAG